MEDNVIRPKQFSRQVLEQKPVPNAPEEISEEDFEKAFDGLEKYLSSDVAKLLDAQQEPVARASDEQYALGLVAYSYQELKKLVVKEAHAEWKRSLYFYETLRSLINECKLMNR